MNTPLLRLGLLALLLASAATALGAAENKDFVAVRRADTARIEATIAGDAARLTALLSDDLSYGYSDGRVQTKAQFLTTVATNRVKFEAYDYLDTQLGEVAPGAVTMSGRVQVRADAGGQPTSFRLRFLAVWHQEEDGRWRLVAYQSAPLAEAAAR